jgi:micrococcal nuclease
LTVRIATTASVMIRSRSSARPARRLRDRTGSASPATGWILCWVFCSCIGAVLVTSCGSTTISATPDRAAVVAVVDGDTIEVDLSGQRERVRLLGVDAPESVHPELPVQCFGREAATALAELVPVGTLVRVERDIEARDRYGRLLLHLHRVDDELHLNRWLVAHGYADTSFYEPNRAYADDLRSARATARRNRNGLWGSCDGPDQPVD